MSDPTLAGLYRIAAVIATVDAVNGPHTLDEHVESVRQVALADQIFITKLDLVDPAKAKTDEAALTARLAAAQSGSENFNASTHRSFDIAAILRSDALARRRRNRQRCAPGSMPPPTSSATNTLTRIPTAMMITPHDHHHLHDRDIASFCFIRDQPIPREALRLLLDALQQNLGPNLLRVKGLINVAEEPDRPAVIQGAQHLLHNLTFLERWPDADRRSKIVFITQGFDRAEVEDMIGLLDRVATRTAAARARAQAQAQTCGQRIARGRAMGDPEDWERRITLRDGRAVFVRPIRPEDEALYGTFLAAVTSEDARMRFLSPVGQLSHSLIEYFTHIDYARAMAFVAIDEATGELLAVVRLHNNAANDSGEYAIVVRSDYKGRGLGWQLMQMMIAYGRARGLRSIEGKVLHENKAMLDMCRQFGFEISIDPKNASICDVRLAL